MSIKNLRSLFQVELKNAQKKWSTDFLPDDDTLVEFTLGGKNAYKDFVTSTGRIVDVLIGKDLLGMITPVNNVHEWEKASVTVLNRYAKTKRIGTFQGLKKAIIVMYMAIMRFVLIPLVMISIIFYQFGESYTLMFYSIAFMHWSIGLSYFYFCNKKYRSILNL